jgi:type IV pilus assembly protein PilV
MATQATPFFGRPLVLAPSGYGGRRSAGGFSLVEVLVSIVVMTIGILGMVGMQAAALQANREARLQSSATVYARELADMIRGNKAIGVLATNNPYIGSFNSSPLVAATAKYCLNVAAGNCASNTEIAQAQMTDWLDRVSADLPGARVTTCIDTAPYDASGLPRWACTTGTGAPIVIKIGWTKTSTDKSQTGANLLDRASIPSVILPVTAGSDT